ncbi:hydroxyethylthiazole kinase [Acinetobacter sp. ANC 5054]|uniref:hydroxyethylthiazole kinase n=1 Tax=Acinetobacter sp. ANC 5054 TaxID=1977877 RepID=UPI000A3363EB|nr:hydroxyethylthiazole kinase [Acinetobacter sp. ANC 5054]OTG81967.1 hydroxyethylthiazole kinase [Acinetobacter sp. ANC 5054]
MNQPENLNSTMDNELTDLTNPLLEKVINAWAELKATQPLVHIITNAVASNYVANVLLAAGASPAMIDNPFEAESFASIASAININLGTPNAEQMQAMQITAQTAQQLNKPWVLDPVGYGPVLPWRSEMVDTLLQYKPTIIRGNASEISGLAGNQSESRGVDSTLNSAEIYLHALPLLEHTECIAISGESDFILSKEMNAVIQINGGSYLQPKVTASGCALGALTAAYCAVSQNISVGAIAAHLHFAIAGLKAYEIASSVGSFNVAFLDEIYNLNEDDFHQFASIQILAL